MALDFICRNTNQHLYELDDKAFAYLEMIFKQVYFRTGIQITPYDDVVLDSGFQKILVAVIDDHIRSADLNKNREKYLFIMEFRGVLNYFLRHGIEIMAYGD